MIPPQTTQKRSPLEALRPIEIFSDLREEQLQWFATSSEERTLSPGDALLHEGDPADAPERQLQFEQYQRRVSPGAGLNQLIEIPSLFTVPL